MTRIFHSPKQDDYEIQMITNLSRKAKSFKWIKNNFHKKVKQSVFIHDKDHGHEKKESIISELKHLQDFDKRDKKDDLEDIDEVFKIKTLD